MVNDIREREAKYHADVEAKQKLVEGNLWEAVASLIDLNSYEVDGKTANGSGKSPKSSVERSTLCTSETKRSKDRSPRPTKKSANLSRMREVCYMYLRNILQLTNVDSRQAVYFSRMSRYGSHMHFLLHRSQILTRHHVYLLKVISSDVSKAF